MLTKNTLSALHRDAWAAFYMDGQTECFEIRTRAMEKNGKPVILDHREYSIGISVADFLTADLEEWDRQSAKLRSCLDTINAGQGAEDGFKMILEIAQYWLAQSGVFTYVAACLLKLYLDYKEGKTLTLDSCEYHMKRLAEFQPRMRDLAKEFFATDNQQNMRALYFNRQATDGGYKKYPMLIFGSVTLCSFVRTPNGFYQRDYLSENEQELDNADLIVTEIGVTHSSWELLGFILYRYLTENLRFRACKYCGRYFGVVGNPKTEYCDRLIDGSTKTCRETGSYRIYTKQKMEDPAVREYKRSYKAHNARIRYGLMTREQFNAWSQEAREKRDQCTAGELSLDAFVAWLDSDKM